MATNHKTGAKITASHTTIIDIALPIINKVERNPHTNKISLGMIKQLKVGTPRLKFLPITGGFKMVIRGRITIQEFFIYTKEAEILQQFISKIFDEKYS